MDMDFAPISILVLLLVGMLLSLFVLGWLIVREASGFKGPSKVFLEKYRRSMREHPEMRGVKPDEKLLVADLSQLTLEDIDQ